MGIHSPPQITNKVISGQTKPYTNTSNDCLYAKLRGYLIWGKFLGIVPLQGLFNTNDGLEHLKFRYFSVDAIPCILISILLLVFSITGFMGLMAKGTDIFATADLPILYLGGFFFCIYFLQGSSQNIQIFRYWRSIKLNFTKEDIKLGRDVFLISGIIFSTLIVVDSAFMLSMYNCYKKSNHEKSFLKSYYDFEYKIWANVLPYDPVQVVLMIGADQFGWFAWIYCDTFLILITRAIYFKLNCLWEIDKSQSIAAKQNLKGTTESKFWILLSKDVDTLCKLVDQLATFLSPLIFMIYTMNIFQMSLAIYAVLTGATGDDPFYSTTLFLHNVGRFSFLHWMAARVSDCSSRMEELFWDCPNEYFSLDVQRAVQKLTSRQIGFHGFKCFYITKPLFLTVLSTLFTIQIFFLQKDASS